ncbi:MAG: glycosyltransferase family 4 protein [Clostridia bacterium]|nr:glycosyltransferase family 4 protein [Clostridia bacterium]
MRIFFACSKSTTVVTFRRKLIEKLLSLGHKVCVSVFDNECEEEIRAMGVEYYCLNDANRGLNPFKLLTLKGRYAKLIKRVNPDIVLTFMLKPNVYGVQGAKNAGVENIYSMVEGAGDVFINNGLKWKLIRKYVCHGYKKAFKHSKRVFFLNNDDKKDFVKRGLVKEEQTEVISGGIGVDVEHFSSQPVTSNNTFLVIARLLKTKGIFEYCEAARLVKEKYKEATFNLVGPEGTVKAEDIKEYIDSGAINYLGPTTDVRPFIRDCGVYVLPSYREGFSVSIMEAQSVGRPIITCDTNGTRDSVVEGYNGFLVPVKNAQALADKMIYFLENPDKVEEMGNNARKYADEKFDHRKINEHICNIILN